MHVSIYLGTYINTCITYTALVSYVSISSTKVHLSIDLLSLMGAYVDTYACENLCEVTHHKMLSPNVRT